MNTHTAPVVNLTCSYSPHMVPQGFSSSVWQPPQTVSMRPVSMQAASMQTVSMQAVGMWGPALLIRAIKQARCTRQQEQYDIDEIRYGTMYCPMRYAYEPQTILRALHTQTTATRSAKG